MKKLKLNIDEIKVESFSTNSVGKFSIGTIKAMEDTMGPTYVECSMPGYCGEMSDGCTPQNPDTNRNTCYGSCQPCNVPDNSLIVNNCKNSAQWCIDTINVNRCPATAPGWFCPSYDGQRCS